MRKILRIFSNILPVPQGLKPSSSCRIEVRLAAARQPVPFELFEPKTYILNRKGCVAIEGTADTSTPLRSGLNQQMLDPLSDAVSTLASFPHLAKTRNIGQPWGSPILFVRRFIPFLTCRQASRLLLINNRPFDRLKAFEGLRPSFSAHVRWCEHGAPVQCAAARTVHSTLNLPQESRLSG